MKSEKWKRGGSCGLFKTEVLDGDKLVATVVTRHRHGRRDPIEPRPEGADNLNLILAAPDLLEVLEAVEPFIGRWHDWIAQMIGNMYDQAEEKFSLEETGFFQHVEEAKNFRRIARAAVAKARGES